MDENELVQHLEKLAAMDKELDTLYAEQDDLQKRIDRLHQQRDRLHSLTRCKVVAGCLGEANHIGAHRV